MIFDALEHGFGYAGELDFAHESASASGPSSLNLRLVAAVESGQSIQSFVQTQTIKNARESRTHVKIGVIKKATNRKR